MGFPVRRHKTYSFIRLEIFSVKRYKRFNVVMWEPTWIQLETYEMNWEEVGES